MARFYCKIGGAVGDIGEIKFGFYAPDDAYKNCGGQLGIIKINNTSSARGIAFGINRPKPPKVRIAYTIGRLGQGSSNDSRKSAIRYCDTDKLGQVLNGGLNNNKITVSRTEYNIDGASMA